VLSFTPDALVRYGWNDRVLALYNHALDAGQRAAAEPLDVFPARIVRVERSACWGICADGVERMLRADPLPAVGDWVLTTTESVRQVLPAWTALTRIDPDGMSVQTIAANVDIVAIVTPADRSGAARVEREIALAWDSGAVPLVVVTKIDVDPGGVVDGLLQRLIGVDVIAVCATQAVGIDALRSRLGDATAVLLGPSGAGKSTLANALLGAERLATGPVREGDSRGRHTTTSRQLVALDGGGVLIDTPGLRSLGLRGDVDITAGFAEIAELAAQCRFGDCRHEAEPGCAINAAVAAGEVSAERLASYHKLARETAWEQRRHDPVLQRQERQVWKARTKQHRARDRFR
jgi:ribosome biogenesis GTPase